MLRFLNINILLKATTLAFVFFLLFFATSVNAHAYSYNNSRLSDTAFTLRILGASLPTCSHTVTDKCVDPAIQCTASNCDLIHKYLAPTINLLSAAFGVIAIISLILGGMNYTTSEGDPQKVSRAKLRIRNTIFAVVAYIFLFAFLQFLIPGGIFK
jgi:hypothetical protein